MPTRTDASYPGEKPSPTTVASVEVDPLDPTSSDRVDASAGGHGPLGFKVFEVTDLTIPAGTDWSDGHVIGSFGITSPGLVLTLDLEIDVVTSPDELQLYAWGSDTSVNAASFTSFGSAHADQTHQHRAAISLELLSGNLAPLSDGTNGYGYVASSAFVDGTLHVGFWTSGPTTADIHVVSAYASFLAI